MQTEHVKLEVTFACDPVPWKLTKERPQTTQGLCSVAKNFLQGPPLNLLCQGVNFLTQDLWGNTPTTAKSKFLQLRNHTPFPKDLEVTLICLCFGYCVFLRTDNSRCQLRASDSPGMSQKSARIPQKLLGDIYIWLFHAHIIKCISEAQLVLWFSLRSRTFFSSCEIFYKTPNMKCRSGAVMCSSWNWTLQPALPPSSPESCSQPSLPPALDDPAVSPPLCSWYFCS